MIVNTKTIMTYCYTIFRRINMSSQGQQFDHGDKVLNFEVMTVRNCDIWKKAPFSLFH